MSSYGEGYVWWVTWPSLMSVGKDDNAPSGSSDIVNYTSQPQEVAQTGGCWGEAGPFKDAIALLMWVDFYCFNQDLVHTASTLTMEVNQDTAELWFLATTWMNTDQHENQVQERLG